MKKTILYIAASTFVLGFALTNCSKKADPVPASTTSTTGTTTTGTTTTSTTAGSTTTSTTAGSTTATTAGSTTASTTAGSTTASTTAGSTTSSTTSGTTTAAMTFNGTGSFTIDGTSYTGTVTYLPGNATALTTVMGSSAPFSVQVRTGTNLLKDGTYPLEGVIPLTSDKAGIAVVNTSPSGSKQYWSSAATGGSVTVSGKTVTFSNIKLTNYVDAKDVMTVSASLTIQ